MFCPNCGMQLPNDVKFCKKCGAAVGTVTSEAGQQAVIQQECSKAGKKSKLGVVIAIIALLLIAIIAAVVFLIVLPKIKQNTYNTYLKQAEAYLEENEREQAIAEYEAAIDTISSKKEPYLALAEIYTELEDYGAALAVLEQCAENCEGEELEYYEIKLPVCDADETSDIDILGSSVIDMVFNTKHIEYTLFEYDIKHEKVKIAYYNKAGKSLGGISSNGIYQGLYDGIYSICECNDEGEVVKRTCYEEDEKIAWYGIYEYDANGNQIKSTFYYEWDAVICYYICEYDAKGNAIKVARYDSDGRARQHDIYEYDESGNVIRKIANNEAGTVEYRYEYDDKNNKIKTSEYYNDGRISWMVEYNEDGQRIRQTLYSYEEKTLLGYSVTETDADGNSETITNYNVDGTVTSYSIREYDEEKNIAKITYYDENGEVKRYSITEYAEYNHENIPIKRTLYNGDGTVKSEEIYY